MRWIVVLFAAVGALAQQKLLIPMDLSQTDHLRAYGIAYWNLQQGRPVDWLLNYRGGSFLMDYLPEIALECRMRGFPSSFWMQPRLRRCTPKFKALRRTWMSCAWSAPPACRLRDAHGKALG